MGWVGKWAAGALVLAVLACCASPRIDPNDPGALRGQLMIFWVGEDRFVYYPAPEDPLVYELPSSLKATTGADSIRPGIIYTDGGSIPSAVRGWAGFSPWGYGPAYIVHDWLFAAHHCIVHARTDLLDPDDRDEADKVRKVSFPASADILAGVIEVLIRQKVVPRHGAAPRAIYSAVDSVIAKGLWDSRDPASCRQPTDVEVAKIRRAIDYQQRLAAGSRFAAPPKPPKDAAVMVYRQIVAPSP
jgi:hypothetical protein